MTTATAARVIESATLPTAVWSDWSCLVRLVVSDPQALTPAVAQLGSLMRRVDRVASRFRIDSELNWANANAGRPVAISATLAELVDTALGEASRSNGCLDPTVGADLRRLGYDRDIALVSDSEDAVVEHTGPRPTWRDVGLDLFAGLLTVPPHSSLDLGASAKAHTADLAAAALHRRFGCDVLVEIGGDLAVAGRLRPWQVTVAERAGRQGQQVSLHEGGLATSSTRIRRWWRGDQEVNHIVDPGTGRPAEGIWRTVSVAARTATHANTCSTTAIVLGDEALAWLHDQRVAARLVDRDGLVVTIGDWPC
jgi:thiamine biosynthesis lipoprotein